MPNVCCELRQEFQEKIEMSTAENEITGHPDPPLGLIMQTSWTAPGPTPTPIRAAPTGAPHVGGSQAGQEGLDLQATWLT